MIKYSLSFLLLLVPFLTIGQEIKGRILNKNNNAALAFVTVVEQGTQNGTYSDIDGYFTIHLQNNTSRLLISCMGFKTVSLAVDGPSPLLIQLEPLAISIKEVVIVPGENPAEIIMRRVIKNKDKNDPEKAVAFTYDSYNKLVFAGIKDTLKNASVLSTNTLDTLSRAKKDFFEDKHLFLLESATHRKHLPPGKDEETILATRVSGLKNPQFALLGTQLQSFSLYGDQVSILDITYLSPISDEAISKYLFILEDSVLMKSNTIYTITFRPRKNKNFAGMKGTLFINSDGWAIQHVIAEPIDTSVSLSIRIQQQYSKKDGVWFPEQLNSFLTFPGMKVNDIAVMGISKSYIRNVNVKPALRKKDFGPVVLSMAPKATQVPDSVWDQYREHELDLKERQTYVFMDSMGKAENFEKKVKLLGMLSTGKIPIGIINIDMNRFAGFNDYENIRLGAGIHSNDFLSDKFSVGGYYAYGFGDEAHKYGGDLLVHLYRKRNAWLQFSFEEDVIESGGRQLEPRPLTFLNNNFYPFFISRMDSYTKKEIAANGRLLGNLSTTIFINEQEIIPYETFGFLLKSTEQATLILRTFHMKQAGVLMRWAPGEKLAVAGQREISLGSKWPVCYLRYTRAVIDEMEAIKGFDRLDASIEKTFKTTLYGDLSFRLSAGYVPEAVPGNLYYNSKGTNTINYDKNDFVGLGAPFTFETMQKNEFMHSEFFSVHLRHQFRDLLFKTKHFKPQLSIVQNMIWGDYKDPERQLSTARVATKGFYESGINIDRILHSGISNVGLGFFYRYGEYAFEDTIDNLVVKLTASFGF